MKYFKLFANCIPVSGASAAIICDLQRGSYVYIPLEMYELLTTELHLPVADIKEMYGTENEATLDEYFEYLVSKDMGFFTDEPELFPPMDMHFESAAVIDNAILDVDESSQHDYDKIFRELDLLGCRFIELRIYASLSLEAIWGILDKTRGMRFRNIDLYLKYTDGYDPAYIISNLLLRFSILSRVVLHDAPYAKDCIPEYGHSLFYIKQALTGADCCGAISKKYFCINIPTFTESLTFNSCLNKKISVDVAGYIRNCPSMKNEYGHSSTTSLIDAINHERFKETWGIHKDQINTCKDCQFRYICTDCRAYVNNLYDKPVKCPYDPYKNTWAGKEMMPDEPGNNTLTPSVVADAANTPLSL